MEPEKARDLICRTIEIIPEPEIRKFTFNAFEKAPEKFFESPASSSGKYHAFENNIQGGLAGIHTIKAALYGYDFSARTCPDKIGIVVSACLLHDTRKGIQDNGEWRGYASNHALKAYQWLEQFDLDAKYKEPIRECVRTHMHDLTLPEEEKILACNPNLPEIQKIVQYSDIAASQAWASFIPGIKLWTLLELRTNDPEMTINGLMTIVTLESAIDKLWGKSKIAKK